MVKKMKKNTTLFSLFTSCLLLFSACSGQKDVQKEDVAFFRDKIINQRILLDDAMKQLDYEKTQVNLLKKQIELNQQQVKQTPNNAQQENLMLVSAKPAPKPVPVVEKASDEDYERLKAELDLWKGRLQKQENQYTLAKQQLRQVLEFLSQNKIEVVKDRMGNMEKLILPILPATPPSTAVPTENTQKYDSLMGMLTTEREVSKTKINDMERTLAGYVKEINRWKGKFNKSGVYLTTDYQANFKVNLTADSSTANSVAFSVVVSRESAKLKSLDLPIRVACKLPNGNMVNTYQGEVSYEKNAPHANIKNMQPFIVETAGWHEVIVYINNQEAYYEDMYFSKK
jgi:hypothetical protein